MIFKSPYNPNSHLTVKERIKMSLPTKVLIERKKLKGRILDFGCGLGKDIDLLNNMGYDITGYDPYYFSEFPEGKFDTIYSNYVLNVLLQEEQAHVIMTISELLNKNGKAYFSVRRDIKRNGFIYNPKHKAKTYQCNVVLPFLSIFKSEYSEIYEYQHYTQINTGNNAILQSWLGNNKSVDIITESATALSIFAINPLTSGHALVIPKRNVSDFFNLNNHEQNACIIVLNRVRDILISKFDPEDFHIFISNYSKKLNITNQALIQIIPLYQKIDLSLVDLLNADQIFSK